ncbi:MAG: dipeptidase, partial [Gemmatimonadetes bacterium]|nr:dipeptidase [Gemmatimonadota bacterium]
MSLDRRAFLRRAASAVFVPPVAGLACGGDDGGGGAGAGAGTGDSVAAGAGAGPSSDVLRVPWTPYDEAFVVDALAGPIQFNIPQEGLPLGPAALDAVRRSGITAVNLTVNGRGEGDVGAYEATRGRIAAWSGELEANPDFLSSGRSVADLTEAKEAGALALVYGLQDGVPFEDDLDRLDVLYADGVRIIQPTYNVQNQLGAGCLAPEDGGLTELGRESVIRMEGLGILLDLSHCGPRTTLDGIEAAEGPVSITHSGCKAIYDHPRSKDDATLRLLADRGGVVGIYLMPFLNAAGPPTAEDVVVHVEHALDICGEDHVGIGSDQGIVPLDVSGAFQEQFDAVSAQRAG